MGTNNSKYSFAKLFQIGEYQVLVTKDVESDEDTLTITETTEIGDGRLTFALSFKDEDARNKCFENYNCEDAEKFLQTMKNILL